MPLENIYQTIYIPKMKIFESDFLHSNELLCLVTTLIFVSSQIQMLQASCHPMRCDIINDAKLFLTVSCSYIAPNFSHYPLRCSVTITTALCYLVLYPMKVTTSGVPLRGCSTTLDC